VIRVHNAAGNVIETHEQAGEFKLVILYFQTSRDAAQASAETSVWESAWAWS